MVFLLANFSCGRADDAVIREFSGTGATTSDFFTVGDRWEVRWNARRVVSVAVMSADGSIVAGSAGVLRGSLFLPLGGRFYFKINDDGQAGSASDVSWHLQVVQVSPESAGLTVYTPYFVPPDSSHRSRRGARDSGAAEAHRRPGRRGGDGAGRQRARRRIRGEDGGGAVHRGAA